MKCLYEDFECDWAPSTGDIECIDCSHYTGVIQNNDPDWLDKLIAKFEKWWKELK